MSTLPSKVSTPAGGHLSPEQQRFTDAELAEELLRTAEEYLQYREEQEAQDRWIDEMEVNSDGAAQNAPAPETANG